MDAAERLLVVLRGLDGVADMRDVMTAMVPAHALAAE